LRWHTFIGIEVHVRLSTATKLFSRSQNVYGPAPNTLVDPHCLGLPGVLPVPQERAVDQALCLAAALGMEIASTSSFDRKHYFYPDLPKNYQITQNFEPLARGGMLVVDGSQGPCAVALRGLHLEEDAARSWEAPDGRVLDLNRAGCPLVELVTRPEIGDPETAGACLRELRRLVRWLDVSDGNMEEGSLRCDANISLSQNQALGTRVEVKNLNSIHAVVSALRYEEERQRIALDSGSDMVAETRSWNAKEGFTAPLRSKELATEYCFLPDPDLPPLSLSSTRIERARNELPELPRARRDRLVQQWELRPEHAKQLSQDRDEGEYFEYVARRVGAVEAAKWVLGEVRRHWREGEWAVQESPVSAEELATWLGALTHAGAPRSLEKEFLGRMFHHGARVDEFEAFLDAHLKSDRQAREALRKVLAESGALVKEYREGKSGLLDHFVGQALRELGGHADARQLRDWCREELDAE
jgi:aspartyl-tRNA(Asn)/glutamyl-tRNA(Gln) amidotransferase subunit B